VCIEIGVAVEFRHDQGDDIRIAVPISIAISI